MQIYISASGCDHNDGSISSPVATLQKAIDIVEKNSCENNEILINNGTYNIEKVVEITNKMPKTVIKPVLDSEVKFSGGRKISGFEKSNCNGVDCWKVKLPNFEDELLFNSLFVNGQRRYRPRLPKKGFYYMKDLPVKNKDLQLFEGNNAFYVENEHICKDWKAINNIMVVVMHYWIEEHMPIKTYDPNTGLVTSQYTSIFALIDDWSGKFAKYYIENVFEALYDKGEWYFDRAEKTLYYIPMDGENIDTAEVYVPVVTQFIKLKGDALNGKYVENISFENITFEYSEIEQKKISGKGFNVEEKVYAADPQAAASIPGVIVFEGARNCNISGCTITHTGWYGIEVGSGCNNINITHCKLNDLGAGGIKIGGAVYGKEEPLHTHHITVTDNQICQAGRFFHSACGILIVNAAWNTVSHNEIFDLYYTGISCGWVWGYADNYTKENHIEKNHIYNLGQGVLSDMGGIYTLGVQPGTVIRGNLIHDIEKANYGGWAIYPDEGSSHIIIENNICYNTSSQPFHQHYGRENIVRNNIFAFGREGQIAYSRVEEHRGITFERNIVVSNGQKMYVFTPGKQTIKPDLNLYYDKSFDNNTDKYIFAEANGKSLSFKEVRDLGLDIHSIIADPLFKDVDNYNFELDNASPAFSLGFVPIDMSDVGIRERKF